MLFDIEDNPSTTFLKYFYFTEQLRPFSTFCEKIGDKHDKWHSTELINYLL